MMNVNDLTVVLTLKDRASFTYRWMRWMNDQEFPYKIFIADGGADKDVEKHLGSYQNYPNLDYEYIRYPYDSDVEVFVRKVADVASRVKTKFVMVADNDDFILLNPLEENLHLMRERDDVHTLGPGQYRFKIHKDPGSIDNLACADDAKITFRRLRYVLDQGLEDSDPLKRMLTVAEKFYSAFIYYGIHRTDDYQRINRRLQEMGTKRSVVIEWFTNNSYAIAGKLILDRSDPFLVRQDDTSQGATSTYSVENSANIFLLRDWSGQLYAMIDNLYEQYAAMGYELDSETFEECFRDAFRKHMLSGMEFRKLADKFRKFPKLYAMGRIVFGIYRGRGDRNISNAELKNNLDLYRVLCFLKQYKHPQSSSINHLSKTL